MSSLCNPEFMLSKFHHLSSMKCARAWFQGQRIYWTSRIHWKQILTLFHSELTEEEAALTRNRFSASLDMTSTPFEVHDEFFDLRNDFLTRPFFHENLLLNSEVLCLNLIQMSLCLRFECYYHLLPTYLYENGFSTLLRLNTKARNKLNVENNMRLVLTKEGSAANLAC